MVGRRETEVGQHNNDFLLVSLVAGIVDDQRREYQKLLLQSIMRMHPERAPEGEREVVVGGTARRDCSSGQFGDAVLLPGRLKAVPVDQAWILDMVFDADAERFADFGANPKTSVRLLDAQYRGSFAVDLDRPPFEAQNHGR